MNNESVCVVLVNYNGYKDTLNCLNSLNKIKYNNYSVIVVDNCSCDYEQLCFGIKSNNYKFDIALLQTNENVGFAGGNNYGIRYNEERGGSDFYMLLNTDTEVGENIISSLIEGVSDATPMCAPKIIFAKTGRIWSAGGFFNNKRGCAVNRLWMKENDGSANVSVTVDFAPFCCVLFKHELLEQVGFMDESYFMYFEDADYCKKMNERGLKICYVPKETVVHNVSNSSGGFRSPFYLEWMALNHKRFIKKFYKNNRKILLRYYLRNYLKICYYFIRLDFKRIKSIKKGMKRANGYKEG